MKKCFGGYLLIGAAVLLSAACSGNLFSKVEVKASPTLYAPLGEKEYVISNYASVEKVADQIGSDTGAKIFTYDVSGSAHDADPYTIMLYYPLLDTAIDFSEYLKKINLDTEIAGLGDQTLTVPDMGSASFSMAVNFQDILMSDTSTSMGGVSQNFSEGIPTSGSVPFNVTSTGFTTATFSAGSLDFAIALTAGTSTFNLSITSLSLQDTSGTVISSVATTIALSGAAASSTTASIPLTGKTLPAAFKIVAAVSASGGTAGTTRTLSFTPSFSSSSTVSGATGLNFTHEIPVSITRALAQSSSFKSATVDTGDIEVVVSGMPSSFTGTTTSLKLKLSQGGTELVSESALTGTGTASDPFLLVLDGKTLTNESLSIQGTFTIEGSNAAFSGVAGSSINLTCTTTSAIDKFTEVVVDASSFEQTVNFSQAIDSELKDWVQSVTFSTVGVNLGIANGLPAGNDLEVTINCPALGIVNQTATYSPGSVLATTQFIGATGQVFTPASYGSIAFTATVLPSGYNSATGTVSIKNVIPGTSYTVSSAATLEDAISQVIVKPQSDYTGTYPESGSGIDLSAIADYIGSNLSFAAIPCKLYISGIDTADFGGTLLLTASYTDSAGAAQTMLLYGTNTTTAKSVSTVTNPLYTTVPTGAVVDSELSGTCSFDIDLAALINAHPKDLVLHYAMNCSTVSLDSTDLGSSKTLKAELVMLFPIQYNVASGGADITFDGVLDGTQTDDLFGRKVGEDNTDLNDLLKGLTGISVKATIVNHTGLTAEALLTEVTDATGATGLSKTLDFSTGTQTLALNAADVEYAVGEIPFNPRLCVHLDQGTYTMAKNATFSLNLSVVAVTDFDQTIDLNGDN